MPEITLRGRKKAVTEALPMVCMVCGDDADLEKSKTFSHSATGAGMWMMFGLAGAIIAAMSAKKMRVDMPVCRRHAHPWLATTLANIFLVAVIIGGLIPLLLPPVLILIGHMRKDISLIEKSWVLWQAALVGWLVSSTYKAFTGRIQPNLGDYARDISNGFQFGLFRHGIFWGWPSSHTAVAFSMSVAFVTLYPKKRALCMLAILYAFFVGLGVSMSIHWLSDAVAGVIIGSICGLAVGKGYMKLKA